jgi:hypothetical protein
MRYDASMPEQQNSLPFGSEFSPSQIDFSEILGLVENHCGNCQALQRAIRDRFFSRHGGGSVKNQNTLAMNCRLGLKAYGVITQDCQMTAFCRALLATRHDSRKLHEELARHILLNLHGMNLIQCIRDMVASGEQVTLASLRTSLAERNIHFPSGGKHPSMMRLWLEKAGIFVGARWQIDEDRLAALIGGSADEFSNLQCLTPGQKAFLRALANTGMSEPLPANHVAALAAATFGVRFPEKSLPKAVLVPLAEAGYLSLKKTTAGRGAKPFLVCATDKLRSDVIGPMLAQLESQIDPKVLALLRQPMDEILAEIPSKNRHRAGLALEALAFKIMRLLDLNYAATRLRAQATGGAEVDLIFDSTRLIYARWQIQCKNTSRVALDDVAKEVGLTHFLKSNAIAIVTTGEIGTEARRYANKIMADSNLCIVMIDGRDLRRIADAPPTIIDVFSREARHAKGLKPLDLAARDNL